jgi:hypothetical protein
MCYDNEKLPVKGIEPLQLIHWIVCLFMLGLFSVLAGGVQRSVPSKLAKDLRWQGLCAAMPSKSRPKHARSQVFCLNSPSVNRPVVSQKAGSFVQDWLRHHPGAIYKRILDTPMMLSDPAGPKETWTWISDGASVLNVELVREGMCSASSMKGDIEDRERLQSQEYDQFCRRIDEAESSAKSDKLGIWR